MKKFVLSILAIIYLANVSGASLQLHYCMGKLVRIGVIPEKQKQCSHCGMKKSTGVAHGCCKDEQKKMSADKDQKAVVASFKLLSSGVAVVHHTHQTLTSTPLLISMAVAYPVSNGPPPERPIYLLNRVFRI